MSCIVGIKQQNHYPCWMLIHFEPQPRAKQQAALVGPLRSGPFAHGTVPIEAVTLVQGILALSDVFALMKNHPMAEVN